MAGPLVSIPDLVSVSATLGSSSEETTTISCLLGTMRPGHSATITVVAIPNAPGALVNAPTVTALVARELLAERTNAGVSIRTSTRPNPVEVGGQVTFTIVVTNQGDREALGVVVTDGLAAFLELVSVAVTPGWATRTTTINCSPGLAPGQTATITIRPVPSIEEPPVDVAAPAALDLDLLHNLSSITLEVVPARG